MTDKNLTHEMKTNFGALTNIVFSFDTTSSMTPCIRQVRKKLRDLAEMMKQDMPNICIGVIAHGDYCDGVNACNVLDLTNDLDQIMSFILNVPSTSGGDNPEAYELALHQANLMSWTEEGGSLVLIGDDQPHGVDYPGNTDKLDWRKELQDLKAKKVNVFPLQCLKDHKHLHVQDAFWNEIAEVCNTPLLFLDSFTDSADTLTSCAYASAGADAYDRYMTFNATNNVTANLADTRNKLSSWVETNTTK